MAKVFNAKSGDIGGEGKEYINYIVHKLKPLIDKKYRTIRTDASIAGSSMGGLISTYAAFVYPHIFKIWLLFHPHIGLISKRKSL
ncbi:hypothetical protein CVD28_12225 [Bacillus sp. M6-12]|uniref:alpha/beta hydrolase-fold protein n=1 Tax=Bacillus sp. M6-12 TaxID=2054166 RepID=UPI000C794A3C|nr:alpha/beta hydrolase-fold protein [Bacillus sp. M6-12]PLS17329.1 hypothetical protein CVD28_12225 [Bacillus sp. M6-12]